MHESANQIIDLYERHAQAWDRLRANQFIERHWFERFHQAMGGHGSVLDLGCGSGEPVARYLIEVGCNVTAVDASDSLVRLCRHRFAHQRWLTADMRGLQLGEKFAGILAWNSFFHLSQADQRRMFAVFRAHAE